MKILIVFLLLFALGLASAAPRWMPMTIPNKHGRVQSKFPLVTGTPRILGGEPQNDKTAMKQVLPLLTLAPNALQLAPTLFEMGNFGASLGKEVVKYVICDPDSQLQEYEERDAKIMALVKVMSDMLAAQENLSQAKKLNMKDNLVAEAELFDSISDALGGALDVIGGVTKEVLCSE